MNKSLTLLELLLAIALLGLIVLGATAIDVASLHFFKSSDTKTTVLNEVSFLLEHIQKHASLVTGWAGDLGYNVSTSSLQLRIDKNDPPTPQNFNDDTRVEYHYDSTSHAIQFSPDDGNSWETLSSRIINCTFSLDNTTFWVNLTARYDPDKEHDPKENPEVSINTRIFFGQHSFNF